MGLKTQLCSSFRELSYFLSVDYCSRKLLWLFYDTLNNENNLGLLFRSLIDVYEAHSPRVTKKIDRIDDL